ncbi:hypothetical protein [Oceanisphaera arctica]|uniref:Uncharacterized protein n=1 Tax=Oceanisphaera arctica TaxID=641510 RepID=A0A2P5TL92_9GAMM|nr:hypothetical protein [Oceanisphaera arctica]PPL16038.1 hypothetical protein UN63_10555 [Oceanisphaera arctica]GHA15311.1 hypothetical protein GCM10007082_15100 [Oceanisphaera arctica]
MSTAVLVSLIILCGLLLGWILHGRATRHITPMLKRLAAETNGVVTSNSPFLMPQLLYSHSGIEVEVSSASTGIDGQSIEYTYVLFKGLPPHDFDFRIRPRTITTRVDEWIGFRQASTLDTGRLKNRLVIRTNDDERMHRLLADHIAVDLLFWAEQKTNRLSDIRTYDDKLIYSIIGLPDDVHEFKRLLHSASRFMDALARVLPREKQGRR